SLTFLIYTLSLHDALPIFYLFKDYIDAYFGIPSIIVDFLIWILVLDALAVIPFAILRAQQRPIKYSIIKIINVFLNAGLTVVFLYLIPQYLQKHPTGFLQNYFIHDFQVGYLFVANLIASLATLLLLSKYYFQLKWSFNKKLLRE